MTSKPSTPFQPAPRPRPLSDAAATEALQAATRELGFGRATSSASGAAAPAAPPEAPAAAPATTTLKPRPSAPRASPKPASGAKTFANADKPKRSPSLKFDIPDDLWDALRIAAVQRRVTLKYLVFEALANQGYNIDMSAIPEDGRRER